MNHLYTTYFISDSKERQAEIDYCLIQNLNNEHIDAVDLFISTLDQHHMTINLADYRHKLNTITLNQIPSYQDWLKHSKNKNEISIFANADIFFNSTIQYAHNLLNNDKKNLVALSRYDVLTNQEIRQHENPHWSQDVWIINSNNIDKIDFLDSLDIKTGLCRCDNQLAYYFAINGWSLYNCFEQINCFHKHSSKIRKYKQKDLDIIGHTAFVFPTLSDQPSDIEICIFPKKNHNIKKCYINSFLCD